jgi:monofunctional biosynthetic peptidoglycan transglycosylase
MLLAYRKYMMESVSQRFRLRTILYFVAAPIAAYYVFVVLALAGLRFIDPPTTGVQTQRRIESWFAKGKYQKRYSPVPLSQISTHLQWAAIAAEDGRFYEHHGFEWDQIEVALKEKEQHKRVRGASTITQQLVKNLFFTTHASYIRKGVEATIVPLAELILGKKRILELYLNVIEWGPGVYGAEAAAQYHFHISAQRLDREHAAHLAAVLPAPRRWKPAHMNDYSAIILERMGQLGR